MLQRHLSSANTYNGLRTVKLNLELFQVYSSKSDKFQAFVNSLQKDPRDFTGGTVAARQNVLLFTNKSISGKKYFEFQKLSL